MHWTDFDAALTDAVIERRVGELLLEQWTSQRLEAWATLLAAHTGPVVADSNATTIDWTSDAALAQVKGLLERAEGSELRRTLGALRHAAPDPRLGEMLATLHSTRPEALRSALPRACFVLALLTHFDSRHLELLESLVVEGARRTRTRVSSRIEAVRAIEVPPAAWLAAQLVKVPALEKKDPTIEALWARAYANPQDLEVRSVLADALSERGDARGAFIARQLAGDASPPSGPLLRHLLGPLLAAVKPESVQFANGFPVRATMSPRLGSHDQLRAIRAREWGTFEELHLLVVLAPSLRSLRRLRMESRRELETWISRRWPLPVRSFSTDSSCVDLVARLPCPLEELEVSHLFSRTPFDFRTVFAAVREVTTLKKLRFTGVSPQWEWDGPFAWSDDALALPSLATVECVTSVGTFTLRSERERFDLLELKPAPHVEESRWFKLFAGCETPAKRFSVNTDDLT